MGNQLNLSNAEIAQIQSQVGPLGSVGQYSAAYRTILAIDDAHRAEGSSALDGPTRYWFEQAAAINANDQTSNANLFIREITTAGLLLDGRSAPDLQAISNSIGSAVIDQITAGRGVPPAGTLIANDISAAIQTGNQTIGGWGGAFTIGTSRISRMRTARRSRRSANTSSLTRTNTRSSSPRTHVRSETRSPPTIRREARWPF